MDRLYRSGNPCVRLVHTDRLRKIVQAIPADAHSLSILDAGCGEGHLIQKLLQERPGNRSTGVDVTDIALERARSRCPGATVLKADLTSLPFANNCFDIATCTEVIEHIPDYRSALAELYRVLKPGGLLIITFPNEPLWTVARFLLGRRPVRVPDHVHAFTPQAFRRADGFRVLRATGIPFSLPFLFSPGYLMVLQRH